MKSSTARRFRNAGYKFKPQEVDKTAHYEPAILAGHEVNQFYAVLHPHNCPITEKTADGIRVGVCAFYLENNWTTCPRHGAVKLRIAGE